MSNEKYLVKVYLNKKNYVKFTLNNTITESVYDLVKWSKKFGAKKIQLLILENFEKNKGGTNEHKS